LVSEIDHKCSAFAAAMARYFTPLCVVSGNGHCQGLRIAFVGADEVEGGEFRQPFASDDRFRYDLHGKAVTRFSQ
jgi:hypothetical protein